MPSAHSRYLLLAAGVLLSLWTVDAVMVEALVPPRSHQLSPLAFEQPFALSSYLQRLFGTTLGSYLRPTGITKPPAAVGIKTFGLREAYHQGLGDKAYQRAKTRFDFSITADNIQASSSNPDCIPAIQTVRQRITRAKDARKYLELRGQSYEDAVCAPSTELDWEDVDVEAPDVTDRTTVLAFAKMAASAYKNETSGWDGQGGFDPTNSFGWEGDGIRGHIFTTHDNDTIVVALKGTSNAFLGGGDTARRDKMNDNLLFSCCCARVSWSWSTVCDCYQGHGDSCGQTCLERALIEKSLYYPAITELYNNISYAYPDSQIWITGHSLGGSLSSLLGMTFGVPTITFQAPGERMAAMRLHLPLPPPKNPDESPVSALPIVHVYNNADPIATGQCNGAASLCSSLGYAMESKCHAGKSIVYDTIGKLGWSQTINAHRINELITDVLSEDWSEKVKKKKNNLDAKSKEIEAEKGDKVRTNGWRWPWHRGEDVDDRGDTDNDTDQDDRLAVPRARSEDKCRDCESWHFTDDDKDQ
ncbi:related to Lipase, required for intravacuolar lysis of autophagic bodies [Ustilago bromivora]|uniref:triacylglycerol lipase n=1 Tax=Ustilago bromivora TaxID=307758 RepID=A0A1K0GY10_9BASI|nr:related to Lipase, required for intravacuolar lysis of autophagic bodies [Ustilago bromivora]SYW81093.1 related to Lipase, required for intravacuolar lysis of autophagic bodies [Ustilago bromivora]